MIINPFNYFRSSSSILPLYEQPTFLKTKPFYKKIIPPTKETILTLGTLVSAIYLYQNPKTATILGTTLTNLPQRVYQSAIGIAEFGKIAIPILANIIYTNLPTGTIPTAIGGLAGFHLLKKAYTNLRGTTKHDSRTLFSKLLGGIPSWITNKASMSVIHLAISQLENYVEQLIQVNGPSNGGSNEAVAFLNNFVITTLEKLKRARNPRELNNLWQQAQKELKSLDSININGFDVSLFSNQDDVLALIGRIDKATHSMVVKSDEIDPNIPSITLKEGKDQTNIALKSFQKISTCHLTYKLVSSLTRGSKKNPLNDSQAVYSLLQMVRDPTLSDDSVKKTFITAFRKQIWNRRDLSIFMRALFVAFIPFAFWFSRLVNYTIGKQLISEIREKLQKFSQESGAKDGESGSSDINLLRLPIRALEDYREACRNIADNGSVTPGDMMAMIVKEIDHPSHNENETVKTIYSRTEFAISKEFTPRIQWRKGIDKKLNIFRKKIEGIRISTIRFLARFIFIDVVVPAAMVVKSLLYLIETPSNFFRKSIMHWLLRSSRIVETMAKSVDISQSKPTKMELALLKAVNQRLREHYYTILNGQTSDSQDPSSNLTWRYNHTEVAKSLLHSLRVANNLRQQTSRDELKGYFKRLQKDGALSISFNNKEKELAFTVPDIKTASYSLERSAFASAEHIFCNSVLRIYEESLKEENLETQFRTMIESAKASLLADPTTTQVTEAEIAKERAKLKSLGELIIDRMVDHTLDQTFYQGSQLPQQIKKKYLDEIDSLLSITTKNPNFLKSWTSELGLILESKDQDRIDCLMAFRKRLSESVDGLVRLSQTLKSDRELPEMGKALVLDYLEETFALVDQFNTYFIYQYNQIAEKVADKEVKDKQNIPPDWDQLGAKTSEVLKVGKDCLLVGKPVTFLADQIQEYQLEVQKIVDTPLPHTKLKKARTLFAATLEDMRALKEDIASYQRKTQFIQNIKTTLTQLSEKKTSTWKQRVMALIKGNGFLSNQAAKNKLKQDIQAYYDNETQNSEAKTYKDRFLNRIDAAYKAALRGENFLEIKKTPLFMDIWEELNTELEEQQSRLESDLSNRGTLFNKNDEIKKVLQEISAISKKAIPTAPSADLAQKLGKKRDAVLKNLFTLNVQAFKKGSLPDKAIRVIAKAEAKKYLSTLSQLFTTGPILTLGIRRAMGAFNQYANSV